MPFSPRLQQQRPHGCRLPDDQRRYLRFDILHRVVDRQTRGHNTAWAIDIHRDFLGGILCLEVQKLRNDERGHTVMDRPVQENDPLFQQTREDVVRTFAPAGLFNHHRDQRVHICIVWIVHKACLILPFAGPYPRNLGLRLIAASKGFKGGRPDHLAGRGFGGLVKQCAPPESSLQN